jgi:SAM domain (Sterile alpha motif)
MDLVVWLRSLGLGKYEAVFRENDIDETVLQSLTAEDLKELGVASQGHRGSGAGLGRAPTGFNRRPL